MKGKRRTQGKGFSYMMAVAMAALFILAAKTASDYWNDWVKGAEANARTEAYFARIPDPSVHLKAFGMTGTTTKRLHLAVLG